MKKYFLIALCALIPIAFNFDVVHAQTNNHTSHTLIQKAQKKQQVVYFIPHPDDEVLTFGPAILKDEREGKDVTLVLMSEGECSSARVAINKRLHKNMFDVKAFGKLRVQDFIKTAKSYHVQRYYTYALKNDDFGYGNTRRIVSSFVKKDKSAQFKSMSPVDLHPDHAIIGRVLEDLQTEHVISPKQTTYFLSIYTDRFKHVKPPFHIQTHRLWAASMDIPELKKAMDIYSIWDPSRHMYAEGKLSVYSQFKRFKRQMYATYYNDLLTKHYPLHYWEHWYAFWKVRNKQKLEALYKKLHHHSMDNVKQIKHKANLHPKLKPKKESTAENPFIHFFHTIFGFHFWPFN